MCYVLKKKYFTDYFSLTGNIKTKQNMLEIPTDWRKTGLDLTQIILNTKTQTTTLKVHSTVSEVWFPTVNQN